ncbi:hypothetical protein Tco_0995503, partial [Tanacetum coccineum]
MQCTPVLLSIIHITPHYIISDYPPTITSRPIFYSPTFLTPTSRLALALRRAKYISRCLAPDFSLRNCDGMIARSFGLLLTCCGGVGGFSSRLHDFLRRWEGKIDDFLRRWEGKIENTERCPFMWLLPQSLDNRVHIVLGLSNVPKHHQKKGELNGAVTIQERTNNKDDAIEEDAAIGNLPKLETPVFGVNEDEHVKEDGSVTIDISTMEKEAKPSAHRMAKKELACNAFDYAI